MDVNQSDFDRIAAIIHSDASPVGIDAKKTHIMILSMLEKMSERLSRLEQKVDNIASK